MLLTNSATEELGNIKRATLALIRFVVWTIAALFCDSIKLTFMMCRLVLTITFQSVRMLDAVFGFLARIVVKVNCLVAGTLLKLVSFYLQASELADLSLSKTESKRPAPAKPRKAKKMSDTGFAQEAAVYDCCARFLHLVDGGPRRCEKMHGFYRDEAVSCECSKRFCCGRGERW